MTIPSLVVKDSAIQNVLSGQTFTDILKFCCDLDLDHKNPISLYDTLVYNNALSNQVWWQKDQLFRRYSRNLYFDHMSLCYDLDLENSKPIFLHALWLMMIHHNTKFGDKMFGSLEDIT